MAASCRDRRVVQNVADTMRGRYEALPIRIESFNERSTRCRLQTDARSGIGGSRPYASDLLSEDRFVDLNLGAVDNGQRNCADPLIAVATHFLEPCEPTATQRYMRALAVGLKLNR